MRQATFALAAFLLFGPLASAQVLELDIRSVNLAIPTPPANRVALNDAIVVGRVIGFEEKEIAAAPGVGGAIVGYRVALVTVIDRVQGAKGAKTLRVGFVHRAPMPLVRPRGWLGHPTLELGVDGLFYLTKHHSEDFLITPMHYDFVPRATPQFEKDLVEARAMAKLLETAPEHLKAKESEERFRAASLLITRYRHNRGVEKAEAIDAEESKLILKGLLEGNWAAPVAGQPHPWTSFMQLGLTPKDGWTPPMTEVQKAAREWLERNWETYRVQRFVRGGLEGEHTAP